MITSSNFFNKTLFNIDHQHTPPHTIDYEQYGPWTQTLINPTDLPLHANKPKRKRNLVQKMINSVALPDRSNLLRRKSVRQDKKQDLQREFSYDDRYRLPLIGQNQLSANLKKSLELQAGLNFITKTKRGSLKKYTDRPKYDTITPRTQIYMRCIMAARQHLFEQNKSKLYIP